MTPADTNKITGPRRATAKDRNRRYVFTLYVTGTTPRSQRAIANILRLCADHLPGRYTLEIIDVFQRPESTREQQILAAPTLIKELPLPLRRFIGDLSNTDRIIRGIELSTDESP